MSTIPPRAAARNLREAQSIGAAVEDLIDPLVGLLWLVTLGLHFHPSLDAFGVLAVVMVFALTYPGRVRLTDGAATVALKSLVTSLSLIAGLVLVGLAGGWLDAVSRQPLLPWFATLPVTIFAAHGLAHLVLPRVFALPGLRARVVVCGANAIGTALVRQFTANPFHGVDFLGYFDDRDAGRMGEAGIELLGSLADLAQFARTQRVDRVYLALPMASQPRILKILEDLKDSTCSIYFAPDIFVTELINGRFESVDGLPVVAVRDTPFASVQNRLLKRLEDLVLSAVALALLAPVMVVIAVAVRLESPGPAVFRQRRYGLDGRQIVVYKFRTMTITEDGASSFTAATRDDARITRLGSILRRTSLDELPQFINVLQGRMSLVGPRPHAIAMNEQFRKLIPGYMLRHKIKPGITGLAQVRGFRGGDDLEEMTKRISSDLEYLRQWSVLLDLSILLRTVAVVLWDRKAY